MKTISAATALVATLLAIATALDFIPATRSWVRSETNPAFISLLHVRKQLNNAEIFQWQAHNKVITPEMQATIDRLRGEIDEIDRQIMEKGLRK